MNRLLIEFEAHTGLTVRQAAELLGYAVPTYYQYRRTDDMPVYAKRHIEVLMMLSRKALSELIKEHVIDHDEL